MIYQRTNSESTHCASDNSANDSLDALLFSDSDFDALLAECDISIRERCTVRRNARAAFHRFFIEGRAL